ncbi:MAG: FkbM family methyltransferase [Actinomycetota bacterium]
MHTIRKIASVTHAFYENGWRGINIEPMEYQFSLLKSARPDDINLNCALGDSEGELEFWSIEGTGLSTAVREAAEKRRAEGRRISSRKVPVKTLKRLCLEFVKEKTIHFLKSMLKVLKKKFCAERISLNFVHGSFS